jgi:hypothetical protein
MNYKLISIFAVLFIILAGTVGAVYVYETRIAVEPTPVVPVVPVTPTECTEEAKVCPDGSSVGRIGPNCAFAECPVVVVPPVKEGTVAELNQKILTNGVYITPLDVVTDSRCPADVTCVWAGEVTLKTTLEKAGVSKVVVLKMGVPTTFEHMLVTLVSVTPENNSKKPYTEDVYRFTFRVTADSAAVLPKTGTIKGTVTTSPTCPVERIPPEPGCAPKPYATAIKVRVEGTVAVIKTIQSNASGAFSASLPIGSYELEAVTENNAIFPRCGKIVAAVTADKTITADISCDTGIR